MGRNVGVDTDIGEWEKRNNINCYGNTECSAFEGDIVSPRIRLLHGARISLNFSCCPQMSVK